MSRAVGPLETFSIRIGTQRLRVAIGGAPKAERTLLLFNGIGASVETMAPFMARFAHTRVVTFDAPGVGESPAPWLPYRPRDVAQLGADVLGHLGVRQAHVIGVSWGGAVAQEFAINHAARCATLTLAATCAGIVMVPGRLNVLFKMLSPRRYTDPAYLMQIGGDLYGGELRLETELLQLHAESMRSPSRLGYLYQLLATVGWTSWPRLHNVQAPALVLMGEDDPIVPPVNGRIIASRLRKATLETVDCGHLFVLTRAARTARRVEAFMDEHAAGAA
ncbi:MAG: poly(3-hydroxyalkanoate) depolymerase [Variovorax sp.]|nr:poly(3-hydroxyalkanoate) depolymerase [Variovorax sp.]